MAVTILNRPKGYILSSTELPVNQIVAAGADAYFGVPAHGLATGDTIYLVTDVEDYNGFFQVEVDSAGTFYIRYDQTTDRVPYIVGKASASVGISAVYFEATLTHGWSCVHLPITYRLSTDLYPVNSADTTRNVNSVQDASGYTVILLSGSLGSAVNSYDFVKLTLPNDTELSGVYQILEFISPTVMIINLEYDSGNNFTSATALKHYNNYNIIVRVYAGINASHQWTAQKPYELAATIPYIPDENNEAFFSINELIKSYIETRNNLILGTLPNNIYFWTNFYIETAESYDDSDGYVFGTFTSNYTSDQANFEGTAINAKLEFKNLQSGYLSDYLMTNNTAKFLTLFTIPVLFQCGTDTPDCYSDISFLNPYDDVTLIIRKEFYLNGNGPVTVDDTITADSGVIRHELEANCEYDRVDISIVNEIGALSGFTNYDDGTGDFAWTLGATPSKTLDGTQESQFLIDDFITQPGVQYTVTYTADFGVNGANLYIYFMDADHNLLNVITVPEFGTGVQSGSVDITPTGSGVYVAYQLVNGGVLNTFTLTASASESTISETKEFRIDCGCCKHEIRLSWLNNLGGMEPTWVFCAEKDVVREIQEAMTTKKNILPTWPKSYGADADTIKKQTLRVSNKAYTVRSQFLTQDEVEAISYIKSSILVQIINSRNDRRTVLVDTDSFIVRKDGDKTHEVAFNISFTDDIPVQTL